MNINSAWRLRDVIANPDWLNRVQAFASTLRTRAHQPGSLLLVGTPSDEPWHLAAHLDDAARWAGLPQLAPTLIRHRVPVGAAAHLSHDLSRLHHATRSETVLVVTPTAPPAELLNRLADARHAGATILSIDADPTALQGVAHEALTVSEDLRSRANGTWAQATSSSTFEAAQHLVALAAAGSSNDTSKGNRVRRLFRV